VLPRSPVILSNFYNCKKNNILTGLKFLFLIYWPRNKY